ncbi:uncharacterized protein OCT59_028866 [Rhizophagus irregularis]|uniref:uncharacterized protein n=1 Tax=Rhizophagus irregularis TaxID=588596 RepID=UPI00332ADA9E|nr:hypothetical protein OCT59_028866 [Rhizophagus irregularis]
MSRATSISSQFRRIRYFFVDIQENPTGGSSGWNRSSNVLKKEEIRNPGACLRSNVGKTEIVIAYADQNVLGDLYIKVLDFHYAKAATFSIDVPDVPTPLLPSKYAITVIIADNPNKPKIHACSYAIFG